MRVEKNGIEYELKDLIQIDAFLSNGWTEKKESPVAVNSQTEDSSVTAEEVRKMKVAELKSLAENLGLDSSLSGAKLKPLIIEKLNL